VELWWSIVGLLSPSGLLPTLAELLSIKIVAMQTWCLIIWSGRCLLFAASCSALLLQICATNQGSGIIRQAMSGHADAINCLDAIPGHSMLLSGSDDGSVRVWDVRALQCVIGFAGCSRPRFQNSPVNSVAVSASQENLLYTASGPSVFLFDLRMPVADQPLQSLVQVTAASEYSLWGQDISQISLHPRGSHLAAVDEGGRVSIVNIAPSNSKPKKQVIRLAARHEALASCVCWRGDPARGDTGIMPGRSNHIFTGGFDMKVLVHRLDQPFGHGAQTPITIAMNEHQDEPLQPRRSTKAGGAFSIRRAAPSGMRAEGLPTINPPFVHALDLTSDGQTLAVACGDGTLRTYALKMDGSVVEILEQGLYQGHQLRTTCLALPRSSRQNRCLTGSDDRSLLLWDIETKSEGENHHTAVMSIDHGAKP
jgi:WD40 repeat protein